VVSLSATPLLALFAGIALAAGLVNQVTPAGLLPQPDRPFAGYGNPAVRTEGRDYPRHAVGADDVRTSIELSPRRVVSQSSSIDEFLYSILPPERIVGVSETAYHVRVSNLLELTSRYKPAVAMNPEQVLRADPDLVLTLDRMGRHSFARQVCPSTACTRCFQRSHQSRRTFGWLGT
jgi:ABC-type Fe3+-hydroxamate transport system substrate-binding protein